MPDPYVSPPTFSDGPYRLRPLAVTDAEALLAVYGDAAAVPFFNGDNCGGDDFHYTTLTRVRQAIEGWEWCREHGDFIRLAVEVEGTVCGTCEFFLRRSADALDESIILRLDVGCAYEQAAPLTGILRLLLPQLHPMLGGRQVVTKVFPGPRREVLLALGFREGMALIGNDGKVYPGYAALPLRGE